MRKAYMIFAYKDEKKVKRLVSSLNYNCDFFIHLDKKADITVFKNELKGFENVHFTERRYNVCWGGWSQVQAIMEMLIAASSFSREYSHIILITETDYPIKNNLDIEQYLTEHNNSEFVLAYNYRKSSEKLKTARCWWFDYPIRNHKLWHFVSSAINKLILRWIPKKDYCYLDGVKTDPWFGQMLFAVTPTCAEYIINVYRKDKKFNRYMRTVYTPCELYYQTIVFNSPFRNNTISGGKEQEWTKDFSWAPLHYYDYKEDIKVFDESNLEELLQSGKLFFRKAVSGRSDTLMDVLDQRRKQK